MPVGLIARPPRVKSPVGTQIDWSHPLSQGLVGCWHFGDYGIKAHDLGPYRVNGVADSQSAFTPQMSPRGIALKRGTNWNNEIAVPQTQAFKLYTQHTLEIFFNPQVGSSLRMVWAYFTAGGTYLWRCYIDASDILYFDSTDGSAYDLLSWSLPTDDAWYHVVRTWINGTAPALYVNGIQRSTGSASTFTHPDTFNFHYFQYEYPSSGTIAYARAWNRRMRAAEIQQLYVEPFAMMRAPRTRMVLYTAGAETQEATAGLAACTVIAISQGAEATGTVERNTSLAVADTIAISQPATGTGTVEQDIAIAAATGAGLDQEAQATGAAIADSALAIATAVSMDQDAQATGAASTDASLSIASSVALDVDAEAIGTVERDISLAIGVSVALDATAEVGISYAEASLAAVATVAIDGEALATGTAESDIALAVAATVALDTQATGAGTVERDAALSVADAIALDATAEVGLIAATCSLADSSVIAISHEALPSGAAIAEPALAASLAVALSPEGLATGIAEATSALSPATAIALDTTAEVGVSQAYASLAIVECTGLPGEAEATGTATATIAIAIVTTQAINPSAQGTGTAETSTSLCAVTAVSLDATSWITLFGATSLATCTTAALDATAEPQTAIASADIAISACASLSLAALGVGTATATSSLALLQAQALSVSSLMGYEFYTALIAAQSIMNANIVGFTPTAEDIWTIYP